MVIRFNVIGKKDGKEVSRKRGFASLEAARKYKLQIEKNGTELVVDDVFQTVLLDQVTIEEVEVLYSR